MMSLWQWFTNLHQDVNLSKKPTRRFLMLLTEDMKKETVSTWEVFLSMVRLHSMVMLDNIVTMDESPVSFQSLSSSPGSGCLRASLVLSRPRPMRPGPNRWYWPSSTQRAAFTPTTCPGWPQIKAKYIAEALAGSWRFWSREAGNGGREGSCFIRGGGQGIWWEICPTRMLLDAKTVWGEIYSHMADKQG